MSHPAPEGKRVTWAELFFDLVFVLGVIQVSTLLGQHHQWWGLARALVVLLPIYWTWVGTSLQTNRLGQDRPRERLSLFAVALCGLVMAIAVPRAYEGGGLQFALGYVAARIVLLLRYPPKQLRDLTHPFSVSLVLTGPLFLLGAFFPDNAREAIWALAALLDLAMVTIMRRRFGALRFDGRHMSERFGLFVLIALGESLIDLGLPLARQDDGVSGGEMLAMVAAFVLVCGLWWTYFGVFNGKIARAFHSARNHPFTHHALYGHFVLIAAIASVAVGFENMVTAPGEELTATHLSLLYGGTAAYLLAIGYLRWAAFQVLRSSRFVTAVLILALIVPALHMPAVVATALLAAVVAAVNPLERRFGRIPAVASPAQST